MLEVTWTSKIKDVVEELDHMFIYLISQTILQSSDDNSGSSLSIEELQNVRRFMNQIEILTKDASSASVHSGKSSNPSELLSGGSLIKEFSRIWTQEKRLAVVNFVLDFTSWTQKTFTSVPV